MELGVLALLVAATPAILWPFLVAVAWAAILAYATWPVFRRVRDGLGGRTALAALAVTLLVVLVVVGPAVAVSVALASEIQQASQERPLPEWVREVPWVGPYLSDRAAVLLGDPAAAQRWILAQAGPRVFGVLGGLAAFGSSGLFVGPIAITLGLVLWREWTEEADPS